jgi:pyrimidine-nucleoside phosphorylase
MKDEESAFELAQEMVDIGTHVGRNTRLQWRRIGRR